MTYNALTTPAFGVAGNFTGHLEQAGEDKDFVCIKTVDANAPKAVFATYIPPCKDFCPKDANTQQNIERKQAAHGVQIVPDFLHVYPFSNDTIYMPKDAQNLQAEAECALLCTANWQNGFLCGLVPTAFAASNDCSIRREGAKKISQKKNWGECSKGIAKNFIALQDFSANGIIDDYCIASFLRRSGTLHKYGVTSAIKNYSYIYQKLITWLIATINTQQDTGPAENVLQFLASCNYPSQILISIGATRYTPFGETHFLAQADELSVVLYPATRYSEAQIFDMVQNNCIQNDDISFLTQIVKASPLS